MCNKPEKSRGANANDYARMKDRRYRRLLESAALPYDYSSFIVETYGAWGNSAIRFRDRVCNPETHPRGDADHNAWNCGSAILVLLYYCTRIVVQRYREINTKMEDAGQLVEYSIQQS